MINDYVQFLNINPYTFYGIAKPDNTYRSDVIWTKEQRRSVSQALSTAQSSLEDMLGYKLGETYQANEPHAFTLNPIRTRYPYILGLGSKVTTDLPQSEITYASEPATIEVATTTPGLIHFYNTVTGEEITVFTYTFANDVMTVSIPRYALLKDDKNPVAGWDYEDLGNFLTHVDVKSISLNATYGDADGTRVMEILDAESGVVRVSSYTSSTRLFLNYSSGLPKDNRSIRAVVQLAHASMFLQPCEDPAIKIAWLWARDIPKSLPSLQVNCPLGQFTGAYEAWQYAAQHKVYRSSPL